MSRVSIVIPTHNRAALLPRAINSAKTAGSDVEVIVVDDASTDPTPEVCRAIEGIRYLRLANNSKLARARNAGIMASSGEFVAFLDDDDIRLPGSIDRQLQVLESHPESSFVYGPVKFADAGNCVLDEKRQPEELFTGDLFWRLLDGNFCHVPSVLVRKKCIQTIGLFDTTVEGVEDWDAWIKLAEQHTVQAVKEPVAVYRLHTQTSGQISSNRLAMSRMSARVQARGLKLPRALAESAEKRNTVRKRYLKFISRWLINDARTALANKNYRRALLYAFAALRYDPARLVQPKTFGRVIEAFSNS